ncbi:MAG: dual specificity protein phosphatase family protein [Candidatus Omnitrophota bacterium]
MKNLIALLTVSSLFLSGCTYDSFINKRDDGAFADVPNFSQVNDGIFRGGRPSTPGVKKLKERGIKTILSLRQDDNLNYVEKHISQQYGVNFLNFSLPDNKVPSDEQIAEFLRIVTNEKSYPIYVHCDLGTSQTNMLIAAYRVMVENWEVEKAYEEARKFYFSSPLPASELKKFVYGLKREEIAVLN